MAEPIVAQRDFLRIIQDVSRDRLPRGAVWNMTNLIPGTMRAVDSGNVGYQGFVSAGGSDGTCRLTMPSATTDGGEVLVSATAPFTAGNTDAWGAIFHYISV